MCIRDRTKADIGGVDGTSAWARVATSPAFRELARTAASPAFRELAKRMADGGFSGSSAPAGMRASTALSEMTKRTKTDIGGTGAWSELLESAQGFSEEREGTLSPSQDQNLPKFSPEMCAAVIAVLCFTWLIAAWLDLAAAYDIELTWSNRFGLIDDLGLIIGGTIATYRASVLALRRLTS